MTDYRKMYDRTFVGHWDLKEEGDTVVTITGVDAGEVNNGSKKNKRPMLSIKGSDKKIVINATNGKTLAALFGNHVEAWIGKKIALYRTTTQVGPEQRECIRIRPKAVSQSAASDEKEQEQP